MKYIVAVNGENKVVDVEGTAATLAGAGTSATLAEVSQVDDALRTIRIGSRTMRVVVRERRARGEYILDIDGHRYMVEALDERTRTIREMSAKSAAPKGPAPVVAPMPGLVTRIRVEVGESVTAGQGVLVMEAMKMENELRASSAGVVKNIKVQPGTAVEKGTVLIELE